VRWFRLDEEGFGVYLPPHYREAFGVVLGDLRELLLADNRDVLRRLYPTAYPDDPDRTEEFAAFAHDQLLATRLDDLDTVETTLEADTLTEEELSAWMKSANELRLVLGTQLDISEDEDPAYDEDHPLAATYELYRFLAAIVDDAVQALATALPTKDD